MLFDKFENLVQTNSLILLRSTEEEVTIDRRVLTESFIVDCSRRFELMFDYSTLRLLTRSWSIQVVTVKKIRI